MSQWQKSVLVVCFLAYGCVTARETRYDLHQVVRVVPQTLEHLTSIVSLLDEKPELDVWRAPTTVNAPVDLRLAPLQRDDVVERLESAGLRTGIVITDIQRMLDLQRRDNSRLRYRPSAAFNYSAYHDLDDISTWLKNVSSVYSNMTSLFTVATSTEGREMVGIKISSAPDTQKPGFWIEGGIHAREWISPATVMYMAGKMLDNYNTDKALTDIVNKFDWYILPVTNPDGYVYTWTKDRLWRKTRSKQGKCFGVDPNRNWDIKWCDKGASRDPCSDQFCGPSAFSEPEVKGVADFLKANPNIKAFIDFHSYSQMWMTPWGYTKDLPKDFSLLDKGAFVAVEALKQLYGTKYVHGSIANTVYVSSGSSADWTYGEAGITFSYGVELRDTGKYGFLLPEDQIIPTGEETLAALVALAEFVFANL